MREISSKEYALKVEDDIEGGIEEEMYDLYSSLAKRYGFEDCGFDWFSTVYYDGYAATIRDDVIKLFEECGMDIRPDDKEW